MRILLARTTQSISGAETYNLALIKELKRNKSSEIVFLTNLQELASRIKSSGVSSKIINLYVEEIGTKKQLLKALLILPWFYFQYAVSIAALEKREKFDVTCLQSMTEKIFLTPVLKIFGYKVVWIEHGPLFASQTSRVITRLYALVSRCVDKIIAVSEDTKNDLMHGDIKGNRIVVQYIGVDTKKFVPSKKKRTNGFTIGFLGTVTKEKGTPEFINIARALSKKNIHFLVIGDGPDLERMKMQVQGEFVGYVESVEEYLRRVDVLLFPTHHHEGISMALLEAGAMGIPVLATDIGGNREIIRDGYNGYLYKINDTKKMISDITKLTKDKNLLTKFKRQSRKLIVEKFNIRKRVKEFERLFKSL